MLHLAHAHARRTAGVGAGAGAGAGAEERNQGAVLHLAPGVMPWTVSRDNVRQEIFWEWV